MGDSLGERFSIAAANILALERVQENIPPVECSTVYSPDGKSLRANVAEIC
jgi:hypothetical protein